MIAAVADDRTEQGRKAAGEGKAVVVGMGP
jgi:hypothetical protein